MRRHGQEKETETKQHGQHTDGLRCRFTKQFESSEALGLMFTLKSKTFIRSTPRASL